MIRFLQSGNKAAKYLIGIFMGMLCLSMVVYLIPGLMSSTEISQSGVVASIGGEEIKTQDVNRMVEQQQRRQRYPETLLPFLRQRALQQLIQAAEIRYEGDRMGLRVSDEEVREELRSPLYAETFFPKGQWMGQQQYEDLLRQNNLTPEIFEREMKSELLSRKVLNAVAAGVDVPPSAIEAAYKEQNTKIKFDYAVISLDDVQKELKPTDAELKKYYDENKARYQNSIPEKRQVSYFVINDQLAQSRVTVTAADLEKYYKDHQEQFKVPDRVKVRHILIKTPSILPGAKPDENAVAEARKKAEDILKQIKAGGNFAELAKKNSDDPGSKAAGGELGWIVKGQTVPEFEKAAFSQEKGQTSDLVQTTYGFHIIQTEEKEVAHQKTLAEVKAETEPLVKQQKVAAEIEKMANAAETEARTLSMDKAAAKFGVQVIESNPVARTDNLAGVGASPELMNAIFIANAKSGAQASHFAQGYVIFEVQKIVPPQTPEFEAIKDTVAKDFKEAQANIKIAQKAQELADRAHAQHDLRKAAKEAGATLKTSDLVGHTSQVPEIGSLSGPASEAFNLKQGEISGPLNLGRTWAVIAVTEHQEPTLGDEFAKSKDTLREQLVSQKREEAMELFVSNLHARLEKEGKLKMNKTEMDLLNGKRRG